VFIWLESTSYAEWIQISLWGWAIMLVLHAVGTATVVGVNFVVGLRLVGFFRPIPSKSLLGLIHIAWAAVALNTFSGFSLFMSAASNYVEDVWFLLKLLLVILASVATWQVQRSVRLNGDAWDSADAVSATSLRWGIGVLVLWTAVVLVGRLIAYL